MCRNELGEIYQWWIFIGVRSLQRVPAPAALVLPAHRKLTTTYPAWLSKRGTAGLGRNTRHIRISKCSDFKQLTLTPPDYAA